VDKKRRDKGEFTPSSPTVRHQLMADSTRDATRRGKTRKRGAGSVGSCIRGLAGLVGGGGLVFINGFVH